MKVKVFKYATDEMWLPIQREANSVKEYTCKTCGKTGTHSTSCADINVIVKNYMKVQSWNA